MNTFRKSEVASMTLSMHLGNHFGLVLTRKKHKIVQVKGCRELEFRLNPILPLSTLDVNQQEKDSKKKANRSNYYIGNT